MIRTWKRFLAFVLVAFLFCGSIPIPQTAQIVKAASESCELTSEKIKDPFLYRDTKEKRSNSSIEEREYQTGDLHEKTEENVTESASKDSLKEEDSSQENSSETDEEEDSDSGMTEAEGTTECKEDETQTENSEDIPEESQDNPQQGSQEDDDSQNSSPEAREEEDIIMDEIVEANTFSALGPHDIDMPDVTSHYFTMQKNSKKVAAASGAYLKIVKNEQEASRYIYREIDQGRLYNFTPRMTAATSVTVGGGDGGGVALSTVKAGDYDQFGDVYTLAKEGKISSKAFNLSRCTTNPYAIYTNVGTWYDEAAKMTYSVDMRLEVTGYLFPSKAIREQQSNVYKAPYMGFCKNMIGVVAMGTDYIQTGITFYYHGTQNPISNLRGVIQFCDIDAQQGVDFGNGFQKIIMFDASGSHLQFYDGGIIGGSKGYVSSRVVTNLNEGDIRTTALGVFAGPTVSCRWTLAKCDHKDSGGNAAYAVKSGYGIPADSSQADAKSYYYSNSTGFLGIYADLGLIPPPGLVEKREYKGGVDPKQSRSREKELKLEDRNEKVTFVLSTASSSPSDLAKAQYTAFVVEDGMEALFEKDGNIRVYTEDVAGGSGFTDVTAYFAITAEEQPDHRTYIRVQATAAALRSADFYGRSYFIHIPARIRSEEELQKRGLSLSRWYQVDNKIGTDLGSGRSYQGTVAAENQGQLFAATNQGIENTLLSNKVGVLITMNLLLRKFGDEENHPVAGVTFGLYGGKAEDYEESMQPLMKAVSGADGYVRFQADSFYHKEYGNGPYHIREIEIPEHYKNVWSPSIQESWSYTIPNLRDLSLYEKQKTIEILQGGPEENPQILWNPTYKNPEKKIKVYKKSSDTKEFLRGASFGLYAWSQSGEKYEKIMDLTEGEDEEGIPYYYNAETFANTMDNCGKYKVVEEKAPEGCILTEEEWTFESNDTTISCSNTFSNDLQRGILKLQKEGEDGKLLEGVRFRIKAAEDIYAPWKQEDDSKDQKNLLVAQGTVVDTLITDQNGEASTTKGHELYLGSYYIEEIEGAEGYVCDSTPHRVDFKYSEDSTQKTVELSTALKNDLMRPSMAVAKLADRTKNDRGEDVSMNAASGRYVDQKVAGIYQEKETVDYTITVTNTGNVVLYDLLLTDAMDQPNALQGYALQDFVRENSAHFEIPEGGYYLSAKGDKIPVALESQKEEEEKKPQMLILDHLAVGDAVAVHFKLQVKDQAANAFALRNEVTLQAKYEKKQGEDVPSDRKDVDTTGLVDEEGNSLVKDWDDINIPGKADGRVAKVANRTTGVSLKKGRYEGKKMEGTYEYGENVDFTIHVTNYGTADLYQILVEDTLDGKLYQSLQPDSIVFEEGIYVTDLGQNVHAIGKEEKDPAKHTLLLDYLQAGDSVELHLSGKVKTGVKADTSLKNNVVITAEYQTGPDTFESVPQTPYMEDFDTIGIVVPDLAVAKKADKTTGVTLKDGRYEGKKKSALYKEGEMVIFSLNVSNTGRGIAKNVVVEEIPSESLLQYVTMKGFAYQKDEVLTTVKGNQVKILAVEDKKVTLNELQAGDAIVLEYEGSVKKEIEADQTLKNVVKITGENLDGTPIPVTEKMKDKDQIRIGKTKEPMASLTDKTLSGKPPKTGDDADLMRYLLCGGSAFLGLGYCLWKRKRVR